MKSEDQKEAFAQGLGAVKWAVERIKALPVKTFDGTAIIALAGLVEMLVAAQDVPTSDGAAFGDKLVERLAIVDRNGRDASEVPRDPDVYSFDEWALLVGKDGIRAVLAELATMPVELPTGAEYADAMRVGGLVSRWIEDWSRPIEQLVHARVAPTIVAKDARIAELEGERNGLRMALDERTEACIELESNVSANECTNAERQQYEQTIENLQRVAVDAHRALDKHGIQAWGDGRQLNVDERIELQQKRIAELERVGLDYDILEETRDQRDIAANRVEELEKRIAELTTPTLAMDGKTPGQVGRYAVRLFTGVLPEHAPDWDDLRFTAKDDWERAIAHVLRAFGGDALRRATVRIEEALNRDGWVSMMHVQVILTDELGKLGAKS